jgi:hypothetical protein
MFFNRLLIYRLKTPIRHSWVKERNFHSKRSAVVAVFLLYTVPILIIHVIQELWHWIVARTIPDRFTTLFLVSLDYWPCSRVNTLQLLLETSEYFLWEPDCST